MARLAVDLMLAKFMAAAIMLMFASSALVVAGDKIKIKIKTGADAGASAAIAEPSAATQVAATATPPIAAANTAALKNHTKPKHLPQLADTAYQTVPLGGGGNTTHGRKLAAVGDRCTIYVRNLCSSMQPFQVSFGYYNPNAFGSATLRGWESRGWYTVAYGQTLTMNAYQTLYVFYSNGQRISNSASAFFCVSYNAYVILIGDDGYYYYQQGFYYYRVSSCAAAGGFWLGSFYAPPYCGATYTSYAC